MDITKEFPAQTRYQRVIDATSEKVRAGVMKVGDALPSLNQVSKEFDISRDTALVAYKKLKERGVIKAVPGKGYFVSATQFEVEYNVFLLFDELNSFKENLYHSFKETLGKNARIDIYFHHFNRKLFEQLIRENTGNYTHYVIMPAQFKNVLPILAALPSEKTYILDQSDAQLDAIYSSVYQSFAEDTYTALLEAEPDLSKYKKLVMVHPGGKEPEGQKKGFVKFCKMHNKNYEVVQNANLKVKKKVLYITPSDRFLVNLIKQAKENKWKLGEDIGIISYNDTPLKEVVGEGIATISTDFPQMGYCLAELLKSNVKENIQNQLLFIKRNSI